MDEVTLTKQQLIDVVGYVLHDERDAAANVLMDAGMSSAEANEVAYAAE